jgi:hypothetical protein
LASVGRRGETINLIALGHGDREDASAPWVEVGVTGPLHGEAAAAGPVRSWSMDPLPMVASALLHAGGQEFNHGVELVRATDRLLAREPEVVELAVDGVRAAFRCWRQSGALGRRTRASIDAHRPVGRQAHVLRARPRRRVQGQNSSHGLTQVDRKSALDSGTVEVCCRGSARAPAVIIG